jgi:hypothetical protein
LLGHYNPPPSSGPPPTSGPIEGGFVGGVEGPRGPDVRARGCRQGNPPVADGLGRRCMQPGQGDETLYGLASGFALEVGSTAAGPGALPGAHEAQRAGQALAWWGAGGFRAREGVAPFEGPPGHPLLGGHLGVVPEGCHPPGGPRRGAPSWSSPSSSHLPGRRAWARAGPCCAVGGPAGLGTHGRVTPEAVDGVAPGWGWDVVRGRRGVRL